MRTRTIAAALAAAALLTLTACDGSGDTSSSRSDSRAQATKDQTKDADPTDTPEETDPADSAAADTEAETAALPDLVGLDLQAAQDEAQAAGFYALDDQDASGQGRLQVYDRNWTVCEQDPAPGTHPTDTLVTLYAVKDNESC